MVARTFRARRRPSSPSRCTRAVARRCDKGFNPVAAPRQSAWGFAALRLRRGAARGFPGVPRDRDTAGTKLADFTGVARATPAEAPSAHVHAVRVIRTG